MQIAEPTLSPAVAPLGGKDDEIEGAGWLDLQPRGAATPSRIRRREIFHQHAFMPGRQGVGGKRPRLLGCGADETGNDEAWGDVEKGSESTFVRLVQKRLGVDLQTVEEERRQRPVSAHAIDVS